MNNSLQDLVKNWKDRIDKRQKAHYYTADRFEKYHYIIGLPATVLTAIAGATLFLDINQQWIKVAVGGVGLFAAILSAVQTFYSHAKRGEEHRTAAFQLGQVRRDIEILEQFPPLDEEELKRQIKEINHRLSAIDEKAPILMIWVMEKVLDKAIERILYTLGK